MDVPYDIGTPEEILGMSCEDAFTVYDTDGSGKLDFNEIKAAICGADGGALSEAELERIFMQFDLNMDGELSLSEFSRMWSQLGGSKARAPPQPLQHRAPASTPAAPTTSPAIVAEVVLSVPTATLQEQASLLTAATAAREFALRAVLTNVDAAHWPLIDEAVEAVLGLPLRAMAGTLQRSTAAVQRTASVAPSRLNW